MVPTSLPDWPAQLRASGRTMTWLARELNISRTYLADVAAGRKHASELLQSRISAALQPDRLDRVREYADQRARWIEVRTAALALAAAISAALGES